VAPWDPAFSAKDLRFAAIADVAGAFAGEADWPTVDSWNDTLARAGFAVEVTFVPQRRPLRRGPGERAPYDREVARARKVPSRERSWHDFLNMLVWAAFPRSKAALHARHLEAAERRESKRPNRGGERDALAMLDEGGVVVAIRPSRASELGAGFDGVGGERLRVLRAEGACNAFVLGHALYERLIEGDATIFAAAVVVATDGDARADADRALGERLSDPREVWTTRALARIGLSSL
jgi:hypothetical protein